MRVLPRNVILKGDAADMLRSLPTGSIDCVITSPPYYGLRDYGVDGQLGLEANVDGWVLRLRRVLAEVARVLKPTGALWLNLGDSYSQHPRFGAPAKSQLLAPERLLLALLADGWIVRNKTIWAKPNAMPTSVADRLNTTYEVVYFMTCNRRYFFDLDAIREPHRSRARVSRRMPPDLSKVIGPLAGTRDGLSRARAAGVPGHPLGKNPGDVWTIATRSFREAHFATFPEEVVRRPLLATCPEAICTACHEPWRRQVTVARMPKAYEHSGEELIRRYGASWQTVHKVGALVSCGCGAPTRPGVVLDPFFGTGTVGIVAERFGRDWVGIELNPEYALMAEGRIAKARAPNEPRGQVRPAA
jgi:site-specific DNA-methyltransferase (adenine-specific)